MRNLQEIIPAFFVGPGGSRLTPEQIAARQAVAKSLLEKATDTSPNAGGWASVAAKGLMGLSSGLQEGRAERAAQANAEADQTLGAKLASIFTSPPSSPSSGGGWTGMAPTADVAPSPSVASALIQSPQMVENQPPVPGLQPSGEGGASYIRQGLVDRGLPEHIADAFVVNFQDESGLDPGINERNPIVPGSRGGFGLYQLTGPRRVAFEQYAAERGVPFDNIDAQLDFMMGELQGSEAKAAKNILSAPDTATAAQAIVRDFLRPSSEYRDSRMAKYAALPTVGGSIGAANAMAEGGQVPGYVDPMVSAPNSRVAPTPSVEVAQALTPQPNMDTNYFPPAPQAGGLDPAVIQALSDPNVSPQNKQIAMTLLEQYQSRQQAAQEQAQAQALRQQEIQQRQAIAQQYGIDPSLVPVDEAWKLALEPAIKGREPQPLMNLGDGTVYDPNLPADQRFIRDPNRQQSVPDSVRALEIRAERAGLQPGTPEYNQFMLTEGKGAGMQLRVGPDGSVEFSESGGLRPLTEAQSKDNVFMTRAQNAMPLIDTFEQNLLSFGENAAGMLPGGMGNYLQSEEYQLGRDAGREFLATILRKDTGAAVTESEEKMYGDMFLPRPGDKPKTVDAKRQRRALAVEAIGAGMSIQQLERVAKAIGAVEPSTAVVDQPAAENPLPPQENGPRKRLKFTADGELIE